jgi:hypothetical protein
MNHKFLLIDYENIQKVDLTGIPEDITVMIFVGQSQKNIPFDLVQQAQRFGERVEWVKIDGQGSNALDFHIAFYLGRLQASHERACLVILSKDKGFDPLVRHINSSRGDCQRINSLVELYGAGSSPPQEQNMRRVIDLLSKVEKGKRPRKRSTLAQHISSMFQKKLDEAEIEKIIDHLFIQKLVSEAGSKLSYNF